MQWYTSGSFYLENYIAVMLEKEHEQKLNDVESVPFICG